MKIKVRFSHIDISSVTCRGKNENEFSLVSLLKAKATSGAVKHAPSLVEAVIEKKIKSLICEYNAGIELETSVLIKKADSDKLCGIAFSVSKIDYALLFRAVKPFILNTADDIFSEILSIIGNDCDNVINSVISSLDDEKRAKIISVIVNRFNEKICDLLNEAAKGKDIDVVIDKITVSK